MNDEPLVDCEVCGAAELKKLVSAAAFRLKGTGWYETDFKNGSRGKSESDVPAETAKGEERSTKDSGTESTSKESKKDSRADNATTTSKSDSNAASNAN